MPHDRSRRRSVALGAVDRPSLPAPLVTLMPTYTVIEVSPEVRDWQSAQGGPMKAYRMLLRDQTGQDIPQVEWSRKPNSSPPVVGEVLDGTLEQTSFGPKFKKAQAMNGGGPRGRDPRDSKRIAVQASHKVAVDILRLAAEVGAWEKPDNVAAIVGQVKTITNVLVAQVEEAGA
jgi:hypothetical protein